MLGFLSGNEQAFLKYMWKFRIPRIPQIDYFGGKGKRGGKKGREIVLPEFKSSYNKSLLIKKLNIGMRIDIDIKVQTKSYAITPPLQFPYIVQKNTS